MTLVGGPTPGTRTQCTQSFFGGDPELPIEVAGAVTLPPVGPTEFALPGLYRADVDAVAGTPIGIASTSGEFELVYAFANGTNKAVRVTSPATHLTGTLTLLREGARMRPGSGLTTEVLLRFDRPGAVAIRARCWCAGIRNPLSGHGWRSPASSTPAATAWQRPRRMPRC